MKQNSPQRLQYFFTTAPLPCPYIPGRMERKIVTELSGPEAAHLHDTLSRSGFRRSHSIAYTPACQGCNACVPVRIAVGAFAPDRTQRRITRLNAGLAVTEAPARATNEQYQLFSRYERERHSDGDMAGMTFYDYRSMVEDSPIDTVVYEFRDAEATLVAACLTDRLDDGFSAVYSFFAPELSRLSLGTYMVLWLVQEACRRGLPYVYLGYWIADSRKMSYKVRFRPLDAFGPDGWQRLNGTASHD